VEFNTDLIIKGQVIANGLIRVGGTSSEFLKADGSVDTISYYHSGNLPTYDNYVSWNLKTNGIQRTTIQSGGNFDIVAGTNMSSSYSAGGVVTLNTKPFGTGADTITEGNDSRVNNGQTAYEWGNHSTFNYPVANNGINNMWQGTQAEYNAIGTPDPNTLYFIHA
jgi:hypothetical protein